MPPPSVIQCADANERFAPFWSGSVKSDGLRVVRVLPDLAANFAVRPAPPAQSREPTTAPVATSRTASTTARSHRRVYHPDDARGEADRAACQLPSVAVFPSTAFVEESGLLPRHHCPQ